MKNYTIDLEPTIEKKQSPRNETVSFLLNYSKSLERIEINKSQSFLLNKN